MFVRKKNNTVAQCPLQLFLSRPGPCSLAQLSPILSENPVSLCQRKQLKFFSQWGWYSCRKSASPQEGAIKILEPNFEYLGCSFIEQIKTGLILGLWPWPNHYFSLVKSCEGLQGNNAVKEETGINEQDPINRPTIGEVKKIIQTLEEFYLFASLVRTWWNHLII